MSAAGSMGRAEDDRPFGAGLGLGLVLNIPFWVVVAIALLRRPLRHLPERFYRLIARAPRPAAVPAPVGRRLGAAERSKRIIAR